MRLACVSFGCGLTLCLLASPPLVLAYFFLLLPFFLVLSWSNQKLINGNLNGVISLFNLYIDACVYPCISVCVCVHAHTLLFFCRNMCKPHAWLPLPPAAVLAFRILIAFLVPLPENLPRFVIRTTIRIKTSCRHSTLASGLAYIVNYTN